jgi:hypothetical protein
MGGHVADAVLPFDKGLRSRAAVPSGFQLNGSLAACAGFNGFVAGSALVRTSFGGHKRTLMSISNCGANHIYSPLFKNIIRARNFSGPKAHLKLQRIE